MEISIPSRVARRLGRPRPTPLTDKRLLELDLPRQLLRASLEMSSASSLETCSLTALPSGFNQILGFLQAEAGDAANFLDHVDLGSACRLQDDVELCLLFSGAAPPASPPAGPAIITAPPAAGSMPLLFLEACFQFLCFEQRQTNEVFCQSFSDQPL